MSVTPPRDGSQDPTRFLGPVDPPPEAPWPAPQRTPAARSQEHLPWDVPLRDERWDAPHPDAGEAADAGWSGQARPAVTPAGPPTTGRPAKSRKALTAGVVALALVLAAGIGVAGALLTRGGDGAASANGPAPHPSGSPSSSSGLVTEVGAPSDAGTPTASPTVAGPVTDAATDPTAATAWVRAGGAKVTGEVMGYRSWNDANGVNVLLTTVEIEHRYDGDAGAQPNQATTRVYLAAGQHESSVRLLRTMTDDNGGRCENDFAAGVTDDSIAVQDTDADGVGEVTVGWYWSCRGDPGPVRLKLALLSGKKKYILRGDGLLATTEDLQRYRSEFGVPPVTFDPEPGKSGWPTGAYELATSVAERVYR